MNKFEELGKQIDQEFAHHRDIIAHLEDELNSQKDKNKGLAEALRIIADMLDPQI